MIVNSIRANHQLFRYRILKNNISFGLNQNNKNAINRLHQNPSDRISIIQSIDMDDPDIQPCIDEFSHIVEESPSNSSEMNVILDRLDSACDKKGIEGCLSCFARYWSSMFLSTRTKASRVMDKLELEHPPIGYLSRTATNPLYENIAIRNIKNADKYILENVEKNVCPDKNLIIELHKILTSDLPYVDSNGIEHNSSCYSGVIRNPELEERLDDFMAWLNRNYDKDDSFQLFAQSYKKLLGICPFHDANGRAIRSFIDALLYSKGYCFKAYPPNYAEVRNMKTDELKNLFEENCQATD